MIEVMLMREKILFKTSNGTAVTTSYLLKALETVKADDAEILFIHTEMSLGIPNMELSRHEIMEELFAIFSRLGTRTLCVPTFTFSFCNGQDYDVTNSKCKMGAFNEYFRKRSDTVRSIDPLMSIALFGKDSDLINNTGKNSVGKDSTFDLLHGKNNVRFLFLGTSPGACMTYTHYVEAMLNVPYRYNRQFTGAITDNKGNTYEDTYTLFVRYQGVIPATDNRLQKYLLSNGSLLCAQCGDSSVYCITEKDAYGYTKEQIEKNIDYMLDCPYPRKHLDDTFEVKDMVAL